MIGVMDETVENKSYGYGKRPLWQWILLYVVIAIIAYGLIYYFFFAKKGYNYNQTGQYQYPTATQQATTPTTTQTTPTGSSTQQQNAVTLTQNGWSPATLTIKVGQTVTWINKSGQVATVNSNPHPTHTDYPPLNLGSFSNGSSLSLVFPKAGTYGYHNHLSPSETGTIIVQ